MKYIWWIIAIVVVIGAGVGVAVLIWQNNQSSDAASEAKTANVAETSEYKNDPTGGNSDAVQIPDESDQTATATGRYETYKADLVDDEGYSSTILFFYAAWCPECRGYEQAIKASTVPDGIQILRVTYDDEQALRQKYGVTIQSTFVRVNSSGEKQTLWNGYGREKSLDEIIKNTK